jgi:transcriptional regulator with XRE-family HTH domain
MMRFMPKPDRVLSAFGNNIRRLRQKKELSQEALAAKAGVDRAYLSGIESGSRNPGVLSVAKLAKALGVTASELMEGVGP